MTHAHVGVARRGGPLNQQKQDRLDRARPWLARARKDYKGYEKVVGQAYLRGQKSLPDDPALAVYLLQQACEKTVKAVAIASGQFEDRQLVRDYSHNSLRLYVDIYLKLLDHPMVGPGLALIKSHLGEKGGKLHTKESAREELLRIKRNIATYVDRSPDTPDWLVEYATLTPEKMKPVLSVLLAISEKTSGSIYRLLGPSIRISSKEVEAYTENPGIDVLQRMLAPSFRSTAVVSPETLEVVANLFPTLGNASLAARLEQAMKDETTPRSAPTFMIGKRTSIEKSLRSCFAMGSLIMLTAFTFAHESWTRYPRSISDSGQTATRADLNCESYNETLGIVACLRDIGRLCQMTICDIDHALDVVADFFPSCAEGIEDRSPFPLE